MWASIVLSQYADVSSFAFSEDESKVVIAVHIDGRPTSTIQIRSTGDGRMIQDIGPYVSYQPAFAMLWSPGGDYLLAAHIAGIDILSAATGRLQAKLQGCGGGWRGIGMAPGGASLETCSDQIIRQWDLSKVLAEIR